MRQIYYAKQLQKPRKRTLAALLFLGLFFIIIFLLLKLTAKPESENVPINPYPTLPPSSPTPAITVSPSATLGQTVQDALIGTHGSYAVVAKNLKTGENYSQNEHLSFSSASLYKLWVMAEAYRQIRDGLLKENDILSEKYETLNDKFNIDPQTAEFTEGTLTLSVDDALNKMIAISDNYAALLLSLKVRLANVASFLKTNGFNESEVGIDGSAPTVTAYDTALFFEKLYNKELVSEQYSDKMLELLKAQKLNDKIPKYLPDNVLVAHKTGELDEYTHDGGIVYMPSGAYIIAVLSKSDDPDAAKNRISNVSESVYNYFLKE